MRNFKDKVVVVAGGANGIGSALAEQIGDYGAKIVLAGRREDRLDLTEEKLVYDGIEAIGFACDVARRSEVERLADFAWETFGRVDAIVNSACMTPAPRAIIDTAEEDVKFVFERNLHAVWNGCTVFAKRFIEQGTPAAIYNVGSENSLFYGAPHNAVHVASKHAVLALTEGLREELPDFVECSLICPGLVRSERGDPTMMTVGMDTDDYASIVVKQMMNGEFFIVSHAYNIEHVDARREELASAYARYAPRYEGDDEFDVRTLLKDANAA